jgi:heme O synthase-like polyprenyltransferase
MGRQSVLPSVALAFVTVAPLVLRHASLAVTGGTPLLSLSFHYFAARLAVVRSNAAARRLLLTSVIYLSSMFVFQVLIKV